MEKDKKKGAGGRGAAGDAVNKGLTKEPGYQVWRDMAPPSQYRYTAAGLSLARPRVRR